MKSNNIIMESRQRNLVIDVMRILCVSLILVLLISLYSINLSAAIVISSLLLMVILGSAKQRSIVKAESIVFESVRLFRFLNKSVEIRFEEITNISYHPGIVNWLIILLPGQSGTKAPELVFKMKSGREMKHHLFKNPTEIGNIINQIENSTKIKVSSS